MSTANMTRVHAIAASRIIAKDVKKDRSQYRPLYVVLNLILAQGRVQLFNCYPPSPII